MKNKNEYHYQKSILFYIFSVDKKSHEEDSRVIHGWGYF